MKRVQPARRVAYETIRAVHDADAYANLLLTSVIRRGGLSGADAALATELTYGTLRRQGTYDAIIREAALRDVDEIDPPLLDALRLGTHQLLSTRVASHAAVDEAVTLAREQAGPRGAGFVNAVLRTISRENPGEWMARITKHARSDDERLGLEHSHPVWVLRAFRRALAAEGRADELTALLIADNHAPTVTMTALPGVARMPDGAVRTRHSPIGFHLGGGSPADAIAAAGGGIRVQDEGSQLAALALARVVPVHAGERWLDLCAGPGGKTAVLAAEALAGGATLDANEVSPARAELVRDAVADVPIDIRVSEEDGRTLLDGQAPYDRILVDAPCTGLGALRRRPEARWRKRAADLTSLTALQTDLLRAALDALAPGGIAAYVTCSPHLAETAGIVADVVRGREAEFEEIDARRVLQDISGDVLDLPQPVDGSRRAQLWPHRHGTDAMSITLLRRG